MTNLAGGVIMVTDLKDPRGKLRCLQQAEDDRLQKADEIVTKFSKYVKSKGLKPIDDHKKLLQELKTSNEKSERE